MKDDPSVESKLNAKLVELNVTLEEELEGCHGYHC
jgi:hypothetical protein